MVCKILNHTDLLGRKKIVMFREVKTINDHGNVNAQTQQRVSISFPFPWQIENASEVLITPLEKFRKEQIGAAKVGGKIDNVFLSLSRRFEKYT